MSVRGAAVPVGQVVPFHRAVAMVPLVHLLWCCGGFAHGLATRRPLGHNARCLMGARAKVKSFATIRLLPLAAANMLLVGEQYRLEPNRSIAFGRKAAQHIPERLAQMVRYYGWYSNRMRGDRQRASLLQDETEKTEFENTEAIAISNIRTKKIPPLVWRECIKKVWEVDPLLCWSGHEHRIPDDLYLRGHRRSHQAEADSIPLPFGQEKAADQLHTDRLYRSAADDKAILCRVADP